jgi:hypothetical protein
MRTLTALSLAAALVVGGVSLAVAQNGPPTGGQPPVAGGAGGDPSGATAKTGTHHTGKTHHSKKSAPKPQ